MAEQSTPPFAGLSPTPTVLAFVAVALVASVVEVAIRGGGVRPLAIAFGAGAGWGLLHGLVWVAVLRGPARLRAPWSAVVHGLLAVAAAVWLADGLGAAARLGTRNAGLAVLALVGACILGMVTFAIARLLAPDDREPPGLRARARRHAALPVAFVAIAIAAAVVDRVLFVGLHPPAHSVLRAVALAGIALTWALLRPWQPRPPRDAVLLGAALLASALPFVLLGGAADPSLASLWSTPATDESIATFRRLTDVDGDGFSALLGGGDCAPFDPEIHPAAVETPDNGIDDDCAGGDATVATIDLDATPIPTDPSPRSVLLVTVETLRADHLGLYGYARDTTPGLARWAEGARVYERAYTAGAWTSIAIPTLLRGVNARRLPWRAFAETNRGRLIPAGERVELEPGERGVQTFMLPDGGGVPPVSWWLQRRGMVTAAIVDDRFSELLDASVGTAEGFDTFVDADSVRGRDPDDRVVDLAIATMAALPRGRPSFVWVHLFGPHSPNTTHPEVPQFGGDGIGNPTVDGYDHEIRFVDAQIDRLLRAAVDRDPSTAWIVTADHGEVLQDGDRMHGFDLSEAVIRVPLVVGGTVLPAGREDAVVSTLDLVPTIFALTETPAPEYLDGVDLHAAPPANRRVLVDTWHRRFDGALLFDQVGVVDGVRAVVFDRTRNAWAMGLLQGAGPEAGIGDAERAELQALIGAYLDAPVLRVGG